MSARAQGPAEAPPIQLGKGPSRPCALMLVCRCGIEVYHREQEYRSTVRICRMFNSGREGQDIAGGQRVFAAKGPETHVPLKDMNRHWPIGAMTW